MKKLKFKVWDIKGKCWIPSNLCRLDLNGNLYTFDDSQDSLDIYLKETIKYEICQYTGFRDKNGKEIFRGYIIKNIDNEKNYEVVFDEGTFKFDNIPINELGYSSEEMSMWKIIGNKFENPELLIMIK